MARSVEDIVALYSELRTERSPIINHMEEFSRMYNGEVIMAIPEVDSLSKPAVANLLAQGLDSTAQRVASVVPKLSFPPLEDGHRRSMNRADMRRRVTTEWWDANRIPMKLRKRARHLIGYGATAVMVRPDFDIQLPCWTVMDPLCVYPAPMDDLDEVTPRYAIYTFRRSLSWLRVKYPAQASVLYKGGPATNNPEGLFTLLEYMDGDETVLVVLGADRYEDPNSIYGAQVATGAPFQELERIPNRSELCPIVMPGRITLNRLQGQYDQLLGIFEMQAALTALNYLSIKRGVFPDLWLLGKPGEIPKIIKEASGLMGETGIVQGGVLQPISQEPTLQVGPTIDRLERAMRIGGDFPAEMSGESASNIRTARRGEAVLSAAIDFPNQEYQEILADSLQAENTRAIAIAKAYWGRKTMSLYTSRSGKKAGPTYIPNDVFETDIHYVKYSFPGTDMNGLVISMGQRVGIGEMSVETAMEIDPMIDDPIRERNRVTAEALEKALLGGIQQQAAQGQIPPNDVAEIMRLVDQNKMNLADAVNKVHEQAQKRQASQAPAGSPPTQPGIAMPGAGAEAGISGPGAGGPKQFAQLLAQLRGPAQVTPAEQTVGAPPNA